MDIFKGLYLLEFSERFKTDLDCKKYLSEIKSKDGFKCVECSHVPYQVCKDFSRTCNIYGQTANAYNITQVESNNGHNFVALHTMIHQIKSWIRTTYSWVSDFNLNRYFNEFCYRIDSSQSKETLSNNLTTKMVNGGKLYQKNLICT